MSITFFVPAPAAAQVDSGEPRSEPAASGQLDRGGAEPIAWPYPEFRLEEYFVVLGSAAMALGALGVGPNVESPTRGRNTVDESVRDALRPSTERGRIRARDTSDLLLTFGASYPILFDGLINAAWHRDSPDTGIQLSLVTVEAMAVTMAIQASIAVTVSRERPYGRTCGTDLDEENLECIGENRYRSYFSGHTSLSFAAAGATCAHHAFLPLHEPGTEWIPCAGLMAVAATTGTMRILADHHYFTDVATGAAVGSLVGFGLPWFLHYRHGRNDDEEETATQLFVTPFHRGAALGGTW